MAHRHPTTYSYPPNCWHDINNTNVKNDRRNSGGRLRQKETKRREKLEEMEETEEIQKMSLK